MRSHFSALMLALFLCVPLAGANPREPMAVEDDLDENRLTTIESYDLPAPWKHLDGGRVTVPVHGNKDLKPGTQRSIMRDAALSDDDL